MTKPKTSTERVRKMRAKDKLKGRYRRDYSATHGEHDQLKGLLKEMRDDQLS